MYIFSGFLKSEFQLQNYLKKCNDHSTEKDWKI